MELMTPVFLCALVAILPQALGISSRQFSSVSDLNKSKFKDDKQLYNKHLFTNGTSELKLSELQFVFMNPMCNECHSCMEQSIKAHKVHSHRNVETKTNDVFNEIDNPEENASHRNKRNLEVDLETKMIKKGTKKSKSKKNKNNKSVSVTKYSKKGKVYALRVKETTTPIMLDLQNQTKAPVSKCQVYRVTESFSCDSVEAEIILKEKRKISKTSIREERNDKINLPSKNKEADSTIVPHFKKRHVVEDSQVSENFMPSIEEMY